METTSTHIRKKTENIFLSKYYAVNENELPFFKYTFFYVTSVYLVYVSIKMCILLFTKNKQNKVHKSVRKER